MKTKMKSLLTVAAVILTGGLVINTARSATEASFPFAEQRASIITTVIDRLGLTGQQLTGIKSVLRSEKDTATALLKEMHSARLELRAAIRQPDASEESIREASAKVAAVEADLALLRSRLYAKIHPILTDEQTKRISSFERMVDGLIDNRINHLGEPEL